MNKKITGKISSGSIIGGMVSRYAVDGTINYGDGRGGTSDYERLINKPRIEGVELIGDMTFSQLNLSKITNSDLEEMLKL